MIVFEPPCSPQYENALYGDSLATLAEVNPLLLLEADAADGTRG